MFDMDLAWWEFVVRGAVVYLALLVMVRLSGRRTVGQFTPFDLLVMLLLSEAVSNSLSGGDDSLGGGLIIAATLLVLNAIVAILSASSRGMSKVLDGTAILIGRDGQFFDKIVRRCRITEADLAPGLRMAGAALFAEEVLGDQVQALVY